MTLIACRLSVAEPFRIHIAGGWFFMGSDSGKTAESPVHRVDSFCMAATQVTLEEYARFLDASGNGPPRYWNAPLSLHPQPVVEVSWFDAVAYCEWLSSMAG